MRRALPSLLGLSLAILAGCAEYPLEQVTPLSCIDDEGCARQGASFVCVIGVCVDPDNTALDQVHLEVRPPETSGYQPQQLLEVRATSEVGRTDILLRSTVNVHGSVVDAVLGTGVHAQVVAVQQDGIPGRALVVTTQAEGPDGGFRLPLVELDSYSLSFWPSESTRPPLFFGGYTVNASSTGDRTLQQGPLLLPGAEELVLVTGRVEAGEGTALLGVEGLEVRVLDGMRRVSSLAKTDVDGAFQVAVTPAATSGALVLEVRPTQQNRLNPTVRTQIDLSEGGLEVNVALGALDAPVPFAGVVHGPDGQPVAGANIYVRGEVGAGTFSTLITADAEGRYDSELRPARYDLAVVSPTSNPTAGLLPSYSVEVSGTAPAPQLNVPERLLASGTVLDDSAAPVENATIELTRISAGGGDVEPLLAGLGWTFTAVTDEQGRWQQRVDPGRYRVVVIPDASTTRPRHTQLIDVSAGQTTHRFRLSPSRIVAGRVTGIGGEVLGMSTVTAYAPLVGEAGAAIELGSTQTKADGSFEILLPDLER